MRLQKKLHDALIINHCNKIKRKLTQSRKRRRRFAKSTSSERKRCWFKDFCAKINKTTFNEHMSSNKILKKMLHKKWKNVWSEYQASSEQRACVALSFQCFKKRLKLHENMTKIENNLVTQMRIERIDLTKYFFHRRVLIVSTSICSCDWFKQFLKHIVLFCSAYNDIRESMLHVVETHNFRQFLDESKCLKIVTRWLMKTDLLTQFSLAIECLEWFRSIKWVKRVHKTSSNVHIISFWRRLLVETKTRTQMKIFISQKIFLLHK